MLIQKISHIRSILILPKRNFCALIGKKENFTVNEKINVGGFNINYLKVGDGPHKIFCFPGILGSMRSHLTSIINGIDKEKFTFYAWDQPGYGFSRPPARIFTDQTFFEDAQLATQFMKAFGHENYSVLGWSGGGVSALLLAIKYPQIVKKLVVWGAWATSDKNDYDNFAQFKSREELTGKMFEALIEEYGAEFVIENWRIWMEIFMSYYTHHNGEICGKDLHKIQCPTLILHGTQDALIYANHGEILHSGIKNSKLIMWEKGKHTLHLRYPDQFNSTFQKFLLE